VVFGTNLSGLAKAVRVYASDDPQERIPPGDRWCDILIEHDFTTPKQFVHRRSDSIEGESDVAMNVNAAGKSLTELPADMVLFFETDFGKDWRGTRGLMKDRGFYKVAPCADPNIKVYEKRWNQVGGPEILTTSHNRGRGCNVAFVDTHVKFVKTADLAKLKWKPDPNEK
jgi:prepilin-type processing-associated H-X9-DG protein